MVVDKASQEAAKDAIIGALLSHDENAGIEPDYDLAKDRAERILAALEMFGWRLKPIRQMLVRAGRDGSAV